jgi:hypothetical protein
VVADGSDRCARNRLNVDLRFDAEEVREVLAPLLDTDGGIAREVHDRRRNTRCVEQRRYLRVDVVIVDWAVRQRVPTCYHRSSLCEGL